MTPKKETNKIISLAFYTNQIGNVTYKFNTPNAVLSMASDRMQFKPALDAALNLGFKSEIHSLHSESYSDILKLEKADICLVTKMSANTNKLNQSMTIANLAALTLLKNRGAKIVVQYCDNIFANTSHKQDSSLIRFYECVFAMADTVTFPCEKLKQMTAKYLNSNIHTFVINDPWQLSQYYAPRKLVSNQRCRLIWFGNNKNLSYLLKKLQSIINDAPQELDFLLTIVGRKEALELTRKHIQHIGFNQPNWRLKLVEWSEREPIKQLEEELAKSHISIIPSDPNDPLKAGVSHNRIVDSIRAGCVTIASPMESYLEFSKLALLGDNFGELLNKAIANYDSYCKNIINLRREKLKTFSPEHNSKCWENFWISVCQS